MRVRSGSYLKICLLFEFEGEGGDRSSEDRMTASGMTTRTILLNWEYFKDNENISSIGVPPTKFEYHPGTTAQRSRPSLPLMWYWYRYLYYYTSWEYLKISIASRTDLALN